MKVEQGDTHQGSGPRWFGFERLRLADGDRAVEVTIASPEQWDRAHLRRLRKSGDLPGVVPIIDSDFSTDGRAFAVTPVVDAPTLADLVDRDELDWRERAAVVEAVAAALHEIHLRGLFHGALTPADVFVIDNDVAVAGVGLGHGGTPPPERRDWTAPEVRDGATPSEHSDVYSLGRVLEGALGDSIDGTPRSIRRLIMWSTSDTSEARPTSAAEFASILAEGLGDDRARFGPAFIPTGDVTDLATTAGPVVAGETGSGESVALAAGIGAAGAAGPADGGTDGADVTVPEVPASDVVELGTEDDRSGQVGTTAAAVTAEVAPGVLVDAAAAGDAGTGRSGAIVAAPTTATVLAAGPAVAAGDAGDDGDRSRLIGLVIAALIVLGLVAGGLALSGGDDGDDQATTDSTDADTDGAAPTDGSDLVAGGATTGDAATDASSGAEPADGLDPVESDTTEGDTTEGDTTEGDTAGSAPSTTGVEDEDGSSGEVEDTTAATEAGGADTGGTAAGGDAPAAGAGDATIGRAEVITGPVASEDAALQLVNGVPQDRLDVYLDGRAVAIDLGTGMIAGPVELPPGSHDVQFFAADPAAPAAATDRSDVPLAAAGFEMGETPASIFGHLGADGEPTLSVFSEPMETLDPGTSRILVRNLMEGAAATVRVAGQEITSLDAGAETAIDLAAGSALVELVGGDGAVLAATTLALDDGELASLAAIGTPAEGTGDLVVQRFSGLSSAPAGVPTGDSGLLDDGTGTDGLRIVYAMMATLAVSGGGILLIRRVRAAR